MTTTEIVLQHSGKSVAVSAEFAENFPGIAPSPEHAELMAEILGDEDIDQASLPRIKVPAGDSDHFAVPIGGETKSMKAIKGIMVHAAPQRAFWTNPDPTGQPPACASSDNKRPDPGGVYALGGEREADNPDGLCATCPMSQKHTDLKGGKLPACKEQRRLYVMMKGSMLPIIVTVPPSSLRSFKQFLVSMLSDRKGWWSVPITVRMEKATNDGGQEFNRVILEKTEDAEPLSETEAVAAHDYGKYIKAMVAPPSVMDDYRGSPHNNGGGVPLGDAPEPEPATP